MRYFIVFITSIVLVASMNFNIIKGIFSDKKVIYTKPNHMESLGSFYDFKVNSLAGKSFDLSIYKGKKVVIINTASKCGFTPQYADWQKFHEEYGDKIAVLGFPANDFMKQEPGTNSDIAEFCQKNYGVTFQMFEKVAVTGSNQHPLYKWLSHQNLNGWNDKAPTWNFCKYVVDENGKLTNFFGSDIKPDNKQFLKSVGI